MGILSWIGMGLIVGLVAKFIMPGKDPGGIIITIIIYKCCPTGEDRLGCVQCGPAVN